MKTPVPARVLIVDDDPELTAMLCAYLEAEGFAVGITHSGEDALSELSATHYDVTILDVMLPGMSGIEVLRKLRQSSAIPVIMLTANGERTAQANGLEIGADDYVAKPYFPRELVARLRAVLRRRDGRRFEFGRTIFEFGPLKIDTETREATADGLFLELTGSEYALLFAFVRAAGAVVTKDELSEQALHRTRQPYDRSIDMHVSNLRQKLSNNPVLAIETVRGVGYRMTAKA